MEANLVRFLEINNTTIGQLTIDGLPTLYTCEDLWRDNARNISCIPEGVYECVPHGWAGSPTKYKDVWMLKNVPDRSAILIHAGNTHADTQGCILVGMEHDGKGTILQSRKAIDLLRKKFGMSRFKLSIARGCA